MLGWGRFTVLSYRGQFPVLLGAVYCLTGGVYCLTGGCTVLLGGVLSYWGVYCLAGGGVLYCLAGGDVLSYWWRCTALLGAV